MTVSREHILSEIRRVALENGGVPLGRDRFREETGIKPSDWEGRFWARWNDAVTEAGLEPNGLNASYQRTAVIEQYLVLVRRFGRIPVRNEMRLAARNEGLPNEKTFAAHLGARRTLVATLLAYCTERPGYEDVAAILDDSALTSDTDTVTKPSDDVAFGFVYLIKSGRFYKIGRSNAAGRREYEIALQLPERTTKVHEIRTDDPPGIETYWHRRFSDRRKNGEWFELTSADIAAFRRRKFM